MGEAAYRVSRERYSWPALAEGVAAVYAKARARVTPPPAAE